MVEALAMGAAPDVERLRGRAWEDFWRREESGRRFVEEEGGDGLVWAREMWRLYLAEFGVRYDTGSGRLEVGVGRAGRGSDLWW